MMDTGFGKDLTAGSVPKNLLRFALPILIGNLLSTGYSVINTMWIGNLLGKNAVGAVAVSFPLFLGMVALCSGATLSTSILISKAYGAKDHSQIQKIVNQSWAIGIILIFIVTIGGLLACDVMLQLLGTPAELMQLANGYLRIMIINFAGMYLSYLISAILRGIGDTVIPLICIILSTALNAVLDPLFILGIGPLPELGLNGAAYSDLLATGVTIVLGLTYTKRKYAKKPVNPNRLSLEKAAVLDILKIGLPSFVQQMLVSMGYAFIILFVNRFNAASTAAFGIASRIDSIVAMPAMAMMMAASALTAQHIGAGKPEGLNRIFKYGILLNIPIILLISLSCISFPHMIMRVFVQEADVIQAGADYLRIVGAGYLFFIVFYVSNGILTGAGRAVSTMIISFISLVLIRIPLAGLLSHTHLGIRGIWLAIVISFAASMVNSLLYYFFGRWRRNIACNKF